MINEAPSFMSLIKENKRLKEEIEALEETVISKRMSLRYLRAYLTCTKRSIVTSRKPNTT